MISIHLMGSLNICYVLNPVIGTRGGEMNSLFVSFEQHALSVLANFWANRYGAITHLCKWQPFLTNSSSQFICKQFGHIFHTQHLAQFQEI